MNTQNRLIHKGLALSVLAASLVLSVGCAKNASSTIYDQAPAAVGPTTTVNLPRDVDAERGTDFSSGATSALQMDSLAALTYYVGNSHPVNSPQDLRISVKLHQVGGVNRYAGDVYVSYYDNSRYYTGHFSTDDGSNPTGSTADAGTAYKGWPHAAYNNWFTDPATGKTVFHGFFQDSWGAILLVADAAVDQGDGNGATEVSGSIWFKNYPTVQIGPNYQGIPCWFITSGAYDCRTFLVDNGTSDGKIDQLTALLPTDSKWFTTTDSHPYIPAEPARGWRRLGTFSGLNKAKAFNN